MTRRNRERLLTAAAATMLGLGTPLGLMGVIDSFQHVPEAGLVDVDTELVPLGIDPEFLFFGPRRCPGQDMLEPTVYPACPAFWF